VHQVRALLKSPLADLVRMPIYGNGYDDRELFQLAHGIVMDTGARD
jgi:hypothetical protein